MLFRRGTALTSFLACTATRTTARLLPSAARPAAWERIVLFHSRFTTRLSCAAVNSVLSLCSVNCCHTMSTVLYLTLHHISVHPSIHRIHLVSYVLTCREDCPKFCLLVICYRTCPDVSRIPYFGDTEAVSFADGVESICILACIVVRLQCPRSYQRSAPTQTAVPQLMTPQLKLRGTPRYHRRHRTHLL